jgi:DNA-binding LytR/AlgR family response regulator
LLDVDEIFYILHEKRKVIVYTADNSYWEYGSMGDIVEQGNESLYRCHHNLTVNLRQIKRVDVDGVHLVDGTPIPMCRSALQHTKKAWLRYVEELAAISKRERESKE